MDMVAELNKHTIFFASNDNVRYYIAMPKGSNYTDTNITIEFREDMEKYDPFINDAVWVKENIVTLFKSVDDYNITLVIPILTKEEQELIVSTYEQKFILFESHIAQYINSAYYGIITSKGIKVNQEIYLIDNTKYRGFLNFFVNRHVGRAKLYTMLQLIEEKTEKVNKPLVEENKPMYKAPIIKEMEDDGKPKPYKTITSGGINFVVGRNDEVLAQENVQNNPSQIPTQNTIQPIENNNIENVKMKVKIPSNIVVGDGQLPKSGGFVSYVAILLVSSLAIFLILYVIIK